MSSIVLQIPVTEDLFLPLPTPRWDEFGLALGVCSVCGPAPTTDACCVICGTQLEVLLP